MAEARHVHVIDSDPRRRAQVASELAQFDLSVEVYEDLEDFGGRLPQTGAVLIADEGPCAAARQLGARLEAARHYLPMAMYSAEPPPQRIVDAMLTGALDYLAWPFDSKLLEQGVERLFDEGERRAQQQRRITTAKAAVDELSAREFDVLELLIDGNTKKEIATRLGISPRTVEIHRGNMMRKLHARSPSDAVRVAFLAGVSAWEDRRLMAA